MHQDQRIGLALGVLLVGACAALFFRNETQVLPNTPRLKNAQELDERIAERATRPYMRGIETIEVADRRRANGSADQEQPSTGPIVAQQQNGSWSLFSLFQRERPKPELAQDRKRAGNVLDAESDVQEFAPISIPIDPQFAGRRESNDKSASEANQSIVADTLPSHANGRTYVVQKGESLSSIAAKLLGDRSRFQEIFEANQDQLDDPNDVKLGMTLRIPDHRNQPGSNAQASQSQSTAGKFVQPLERLRSDSERRINTVPPVVDINSNNSRIGTHDLPSIAPPTESPVGARANSSAPKKFVPAKRSPLPRPVGPQASAGDQRNVAGRRLSQISQESTSGKIAR